MKRLGVLLLVLSLLLLSGCGAPEETPPESEASSGAETIWSPLGEQLGAPAHIEGEFTSESGKSTVKVDAEVFVPWASGANLIEVFPRLFTQEEINTMAERHGGGLSWKHEGEGEIKRGQPYYREEMPEIDERDNRAWIDSYFLWISAGDSRNRLEALKEEEEYRDLSVRYNLNSSTGALASLPAMEFGQGIGSLGAFDNPEIYPLTDGKAEGCTISPAEAIALAEEEVRALAPDYYLYECGQLPVYSALKNPRYYALRFTREIGGIPVNGTYHTEAGNAYEYVSGTSKIDVVVRDSGVCALQYYNPEDLGEVKEENVKLLPFSDIWDIFSQVGLLSIQWVESEEDVQVNRLTITEIRFGYMKVWQPDGSYLYTPVWDFYGTDFLSGTGAYAHAADFEYAKDCKLTINAMNGTVIDRGLGY